MALPQNPTRKPEAEHPKEEYESETTTSCTSDSVAESSMAAESSRERLKRHRVEVAGRVRIPDTWGQEELLKDWIECTKFDVSCSKMYARDALVAQAAARKRIRRSTTNSDVPAPRILTLENNC